MSVKSGDQFSHSQASSKTASGSAGKPAKADKPAKAGGGRKSDKARTAVGSASGKRASAASLAAGSKGRVVKSGKNRKKDNPPQPSGILREAASSHPAIAPAADATSSPETVSAPVIDLNDAALYINRELSQLQFNARVLYQVLDERHPPLIRMLFCCIFSSNMDEFFEIRVAGLRQQIKYEREFIGPDGLSPKRVLQEVAETTHQLVTQQYDLLNNVLIPELARHDIHFLRRTDWTGRQRDWISRYFERDLLPIINPIGLDPSHPFPRLVNKSLNFIVELDGKDAFGRETGLAIVPAPRSLPRLLLLPDEVCEGGRNMVFLSSIIHAHADELFPGMTVRGLYQFRITRNADLVLEEDDMEDLAQALRGELLSRRFGDAVRLEVADNCPEELVQFLLAEFGLGEQECYRVAGPVNLTRMMAVSALVDRPELLYPNFTPGLPREILQKDNLFDSIRRNDILLLHPFQSFIPVIDLLRQAAKDPDVLAIRQTLYRSGAQSEIVAALADAAKHGKEVTAVIELRARFDEAENLELASKLQEAGVIVVYGVVGYKTHAKMILIVRREQGALRRYVHLGTGNYHANNARLYTDYSLLSCDRALAEDVHRLFLQLTGMGKALKIKKMFHAPFTLHDKLLQSIQREANLARAGRPARILAKFNALTEPRVIKALYEASQAGVQIDLIIRGVCSLRPGLPGISENIRVVSVVGRFLEHTRSFYFHNDGESEIYASSADWMVRNLVNRVEAAFPIESRKLANRMLDEMSAYLKDTVNSWRLRSDGQYERILPEPEATPFSAQAYLLERLSLN